MLYISWCGHVVCVPFSLFHCVCIEDQSAETVMQHMDQQYAPLHLVSMVSKHGTSLQLANAKDSDLLTKERLCRALSMFEVVLKRLRGILMKDMEVNVCTHCTCTCTHTVLYHWHVVVMCTCLGSMVLSVIPSVIQNVHKYILWCSYSCTAGTKR